MSVVNPAPSASPLSPTAIREDAGGRYREEATFLGHSGERMYVVTHIPEERSAEGVVICSSILVEHLTNYRREVLLARRLAEGGMAVLRFHYRGAGHSTGEESQVTLPSMVEDALAAAARLQAQAGIRRVAFMGTRFGALVAARAAAARPGARLILWEPVLDADRYFRELIRARLVHELRDGPPSGSRTPDAWKGEMAEHGAAEIMGHRLYRALYESALGLRLPALLPESAPAVLLLQMGGGSVIRPGIEALRGAIGERGGRADIKVVPDDPVWLFVGQRTMRSAEEPIRLTADWLLAEVPRA